jgi:hypothetical protein
MNVVLIMTRGCDVEGVFADVRVRRKPAKAAAAAGGSALCSCILNAQNV